MRQWRWRPQRRAGALKENLQRCLPARLLWGQWRGWCGGPSCSSSFHYRQLQFEYIRFFFSFIYLFLFHVGRRWNETAVSAGPSAERPLEPGTKVAAQSKTTQSKP